LSRNEEDDPRNFVIRIKGLENLLYANFLCELNKRLIAPFIQKYSPIYPHFNTTFGRFFYGIITNGKSVHDTRRIFYYGTHTSEFEYRLSNQMTRIEVFLPFENGFQDGYTAHFRFSPKLDYYYETIDISNIQLDLSYFQWFFKKLNKIE
jgi:hypothetical protein